VDTIGDLFQIQSTQFLRCCSGSPSSPKTGIRGHLRAASANLRTAPGFNIGYNLWNSGIGVHACKIQFLPRHLKNRMSEGLSRFGNQRRELILNSHGLNNKQTAMIAAPQTCHFRLPSSTPITGEKRTKKRRLVTSRKDMPFKDGTEKNEPRATAMA